MATLDFKGKALVQNYHLTVKYHELVPKRDRSLTDKVRLDDNLIIHGDNLKALKALLPTYASQVECIYIDPPYNTGSEGWAYNDNVNSPMMHEWLGKVVDNDDLTRHDKWLCMMMPRLKLLKELLSNDGVIFASIDDHESANLKKLMEEVFGEENFIDTIAVEMSTTSGPKTVNAQQGTIVKNVEFVHVFQKSAEFDKKTHTPLRDGILAYDTHYSMWLNDDGTLGTLAEKLLADAKIKAEIRQYGLMERETFSFNNIDKLLLISESAKSFVEANLKKIASVDRPPVSAEGIATKVGHWKAFEADHRTYYLTTLANGTLRALMPLSLNYRMSDDYKPRFGRTVLRGDLWKGFHQDMGNVAKEGDTPFSNGKKPVRLIKQLIKWSGSTGDAIILDSFAGSGTTAHAVLALNKEDGGNRKFILVQCDELNNETGRIEDICNNITAERVRRVIKGVKGASDENLKKGLGGTFSYFELGKAIELDSILDGKNLPSYLELARYVFYTATGEEFDERKVNEKRSFVGESKTHEVYLFYQPDMDYLKKTALTLERAESLGKLKDKRRLVFAPTKYLDQEQLDALRIDFAQLPFEIYKLAT